MSIELSLGDTPPPPSLNLPGDVPGVDATPEVPEGPSAEILALNETFGADFSTFSSSEDAQRAALLVAQSYAQAGNVAPQRQAPAAPVAPAAPAAPAVEEDYGDLDPKVVERLKRMDNELKQTRAQAQQFQDRIAHDQQMLQQQQHQDILNRALGAIDELADARYGVAGNRTFTQDLARENLLRTADRIVAGMRAAGRNPPPIEKLVRMAVLAESGKLPTAKAAAAAVKGASPAPIAGGSNVQGVPQVPRRKTGGEVDTYTADKEFMDGARAIVSRGRR